MGIKFTDHSQQNRLREISVTEKLEADARARRGSIASSLITRASPNATTGLIKEKRIRTKGTGQLGRLKTTQEYIDRVLADGGIVEAAKCLNNELYYYGFD